MWPPFFNFNLELARHNNLAPCAYNSQDTYASFRIIFSACSPINSIKRYKASHLQNTENMLSVVL